MAANMKDIAKATNLSIATVSNYINGNKIRPQNAAKIEQAIQSLNYRVNTIARGLKTSKSLLLGALVPNATEIFSLQIIMAIDKYMSELGYRCLICDCQLDSSIMIKNLDLLLEKQVDGIFMFPLLGNPNLINTIRSIDTPVVILDQQLKELQLDTVLVDNENSSYNVVNTLIHKGHKRIAIICGPDVNFTSQERLKGYLKAFNDNNIAIDHNLIVHGDYSTKSGYELMYRLWNRPVRPSAVYATNGYTTSGAMLAARELNINIGEEMELFAFDNYEIARIAKPPLPVVIQPLDELGKAAARIMEKRLRKDLSGFPETVILPTEIRYTL